jgi:hypothetical protein
VLAEINSTKPVSKAHPQRFRFQRLRTTVDPHQLVISVMESEPHEVLAASGATEQKPQFALQAGGRGLSPLSTAGGKTPTFDLAGEVYGYRGVFICVCSVLIRRPCLSRDNPRRHELHSLSISAEDLSIPSQKAPLASH